MLPNLRAVAVEFAASLKCLATIAVGLPALEVLGIHVRDEKEQFPILPAHSPSKLLKLELGNSWISDPLRTAEFVLSAFPNFAGDPKPRGPQSFDWANRSEWQVQKEERLEGYRRAHYDMKCSLQVVPM